MVIMLGGDDNVDGDDVYDDADGDGDECELSFPRSDIIEKVSMKLWNTWDSVILVPHFV